MKKFRRIERATYKIQSIATVLFEFTQDYETATKQKVAHINTVLKYLLTETDKIIQTF